MSNLLVRLTPLQAKVYFTIKQHGPLGPSQIGSRLGFEYEASAQRVTRPIKKLIKLNLISCERKNSRVVAYAAAHEIDPPFELTRRED